MTLYLWQNIMAYDVPNAVTLGYDVDALASHLFASENDNDDNKHVNLDGKNYFNIRATSRTLTQNPPDRPSVDGLSDGILNQTLHYSILSKSLYPWTDAIPKSIYMEYVVPYAVVNEPRTDYRSLLFDALRDILKEYERPLIINNNAYLVGDKQRQPSQNLLSYAQTQTQIKRVVKSINTRLWSILARRSSQPITFQAGLTPRIYDPLSVISHGHSSCTGLAILLIAALRTVGIPARMAGTPAWNGVEEKGNHSWLEVFLPADGHDNNNDGDKYEDEGGKWIFLEPTPGIAEGEEKSANADDLDRDPCKRWFCKASRFDGSTRVFASRYTKTERRVLEEMSDLRNLWLDEDSKRSSETFYRMAWAVGEEHVPGLDRTEYYNKHCGECDNRKNL